MLPTRISASLVVAGLLARVPVYATAPAEPYGQAREIYSTIVGF